jgi:hypothetical protein
MVRGQHAERAVIGCSGVLSLVVPSGGHAGVPGSANQLVDSSRGVRSIWYPVSDLNLHSMFPALAGNRVQGSNGSQDGRAPTIERV